LSRSAAGSSYSRQHVARAVHAVRLRNLRPADTAAIVGDGALAVATMAVAVVRGVGRVTLVTDSETAQAAAERAGAVRLPRPATEETLQATLEALGNFGADVVFECEGDAASRILAIQLVRPAGTVVLVSDAGDATPMSPNLLVMADKRVQGSRGFEAGDLEIADALVEAGRLPLDVAGSGDRA
jgi:threonine dehydrogenase-like Zn-dependent dehydrogenase